MNTKCAGTGFSVPARWFLCFFSAAVLFPEHRKADEQQIRLVPDLPAAERRDAPGKPAGGDDGGGSAEFRFHTLDHPVEQGSRAVDRAGLHAGDGVRPDALCGRVERDTRQLRRIAGERFHRQTKPRHDRAAGKAALRVYGGDGRGGAHVDDDERRAVQMQRRDRADDEVRPDLAWIVEPDVQPGFETLADNERIQPREELYRPAQRGRERPDDV